MTPMERGGVTSRPATRGDDATARAAMLLGALVLLLCWPEGPPGSRSCEEPRERASKADWTSDVSCSATAEFSARPLRGPARLLFGQPLDLNHADAEALETLPGIGPRRASAILETRSRRPFRDTRDLMRVNGIGPKTLARLEPWIRAGGELD